jgi:hypothetical protein
VRAQDLNVYLHALQCLLERAEEVLGVGVVAAFGVRDAGEAVADIALEVSRDAGGDLAQRIYRVRVEDETDFRTPGFKGVDDRLGDQYLTQVADVNVAGRADPCYDHVRARPELLGYLLGPIGDRMAVTGHALLH